MRTGAGVAKREDGAAALLTSSRQKSRGPAQKNHRAGIYRYPVNEADRSRCTTRGALAPVRITLTPCADLGWAGSDMNQPSSQARLILEHYKAAEAPRADQRMRLGDVIRQRAMRGDLPRFDVQATSPAIANGGLAQHAWGSSAGKACLVLLALGVGVGITHQLKHDSRRAQLEELAPVAVQAHAAAAPRSARKPAPEPQSAAKGEEVEGSLQTPAPVKPGRPLASAGEPTIDEEVTLVKSAQEALQAGDTKRALQFLNEHAARFPTGKLASVRQVTHMTALCQAGQTERARQEATSFLAKNASSPFSERVKTICR